MWRGKQVNGLDGNDADNCFSIYLRANKVLKWILTSVCRPSEIDPFSQSGCSRTYVFLSNVLHFFWTSVFNVYILAADISKVSGVMATLLMDTLLMDTEPFHLSFLFARILINLWDFALCSLKWKASQKRLARILKNKKVSAVPTFKDFFFQKLQNYTTTLMLSTFIM